MILPSLPAATPEPLPRAARSALLAGMIAAHAALAWSLWQLQPQASPAGEGSPVEVYWMAPPAPAMPPAPKSAARPVKAPAPAPVPRPRPVSVPEAAPAAQEFVVAEPAPAPSTEPSTEPVAAATPAPAESLPAAPPPPAPTTVAISAVEYLVPPVLTYPPASRRLRERGRVEVRLLVDARGMPQQAQLLRSSGHERLDEAALATVRATRFKPYTENGVPQPFRVVMPLVFELEN